MPCKKRAIVTFGGGRSIEIPQPEHINIRLQEPGQRTFNFDLAVDRKGLRNLNAVFRKLGGKGEL
jgi:hypothetical protein